MDIFDRAEDEEQKHRDRSIQAVLSSCRETEEPDEEDGIRYCLDCGGVIPEERLKARPESVRCVDCKELKELRSKR